MHYVPPTIKQNTINKLGELLFICTKVTLEVTSTVSHFYTGFFFSFYLMFAQQVQQFVGRISLLQTSWESEFEFHCICAFRIIVRKETFLPSINPYIQTNLNVAIKFQFRYFNILPPPPLQFYKKFKSIQKKNIQNIKKPMRKRAPLLEEKKN